MTRKLGEWKFKKNTTAVERRIYLQNGVRCANQPQDGTSSIKISSAKFERWKKAMAYEECGTKIVETKNILTGSFSLVYMCHFKC
jgi:hypothetical protein